MEDDFGDGLVLVLVEQNVQLFDESLLEELAVLPLAICREEEAVDDFYVLLTKVLASVDVIDMELLWRVYILLLLLVILLPISQTRHLIMTDPQALYCGRLNEVTLRHIESFHVQEVQHFHNQHFLDPIGVRQVNPAESLYLLNLELYCLVLLL